jgi:hypothetical protein
MIGTKSLAITVMSWPSTVNFWTPSEPALISRSRCTLPGVNLKLARPALFVHCVLSPEATVEQSKFPFPLIRLLSEEGPYLPSDFGLVDTPASGRMAKCTYHFGDVFSYNILDDRVVISMEPISKENWSNICV